MSRKLPYFQFEPGEYLTRDISYCDMKLQGLFINICSYYWQRDCELTKTQLLKRLPYEDELNILIKEGIIDIKDDNIKIKFLLFQFNEIQSKSRVNSTNGSKGGRPKKTEIKPKLNPNIKPNETETKAIREDKIIEDKTIQDKKYNNGYDFLRVHSKSDLEVFEMQNKNSFDNYNKFIDYFNNKVTFEDVEFTSKKLMSRLRMLNDNWSKKPKTKQNKKPTDNITF